MKPGGKKRITEAALREYWDFTQRPITSRELGKILGYTTSYVQAALQGSDEAIRVDERGPYKAEMYRPFTEKDQKEREEYARWVEENEEQHCSGCSCFD